MASAVQPFIPDHAVRFAQQLFDFLTSKLSIAGYDRLVFGEAARPTEAVVQTTPGTFHQYVRFLLVLPSYS